MIKTHVLTSSTYSDYAEIVLSRLSPYIKDISYSYSSIINIDSASLDMEMNKYLDEVDGFIFLLHNGETKSSLFEKAYTTAAFLCETFDKFLFFGIATDATVPIQFKIPGTIYTYRYPVEDVSEIVEELVNVIEKYISSKTDNERISLKVVENAQKMLSELGYYTGEFHGEMDEIFVESLIDYKKNKNLSHPDRLDGETFDLMESEVAVLHKSNGQQKPNQWIYAYDKKNIHDSSLEDSIWLEFPLKKNSKTLEQPSYEDSVWGYDISNAWIKYRFALDKISEGGFILIVAEIYPKAVPLKLLKGHSDFARKLIKTTNKEFLPLNDSSDPDLAKIIATYNDKPSKTLNNETSYTSDLNFAETTDQLDFLHDIEAFASIIAMKKVEPPLAIGLFGYWGSGKSFFMEKLSERITHNTGKNEPRFLKHIVQVKFNSWHYSDGNLWASLISHIFESLNDYATKKKFGKELVKDIYSQLSITNMQLSETNLKIEAKNAEVKNIEDSIRQVDEKIKLKRSRLESLRLKDYFSIIIEDSEIHKQLAELRTNYISNKNIKNIQDIIDTTNEYHGFLKQIVKAIQLFKNTKGRKWRIFWICLVVCFGFIFLLNCDPIAQLITARLRPFFTGLVSVAIIFAGARKQLKPYYDHVKKLYVHISRLKEAALAKQRNIKINEEDEKEKLQHSLDELNLNKVALVAEKAFKTSEKEILETQVEDIGNGKMLSSFFAEKSADENYAKHLGIVSWIRKDFSKLSDLLIQQSAVNTQATMDGSEQEGKIQIDRIVLFIDDLDRCSADTVVKMLEAIHLLLAFKLFVVVVGVDPRWLNNALDSQFSVLFGKSEPGNRIRQNAITSYDYLEKIFQIPFALKPINNEGRSKLVAYLTEQDLEENADEELKDDHPERILRMTNNDKGLLKKGLVFSDDEGLEPINPGVEIIDFIQGKRIILSRPEIEFMQKMSANFNTPRTIKRFVNIYRLIKAHRSYKFIADTEKMDFVPTLLLLSVIVGCPDSAHEFLHKLREEKSNPLLKDFIDKLENEMLTAFLNRISDAEIDNLMVVELCENLDLISRFSFRTYLH